MEKPRVITFIYVRNAYMYFYLHIPRFIFLLKRRSLDRFVSIASSHGYTTDVLCIDYTEYTRIV